MMDIYQHFREEERPFIDQALSWKDEVETIYQAKLTDFLDPRQQEILHMLAGTQEDVLKLGFLGGGPHAERKRAIVAPFYEEMPADAFELSVLEATYPEKFVALSHRDVMGAFLSLGIKRKKLGDIFIYNGIVQLVTAKDIAPFVLANLTGIKKASLQFKEKSLDALMEKKHHWVEVDKTVASLRLDAVLKEIYRISRKDAVQLIEAGLVKVNFKIVEDAKFMLQEGDMLSVRGKGRSRLTDINGRTKKDKWKITAAVLH